MSEVDNQSTGSIVVSAAGAWLGLGAGLALTLLALLAVAGQVVDSNISQRARSALQRNLGADMNSLVAGTASLSEDRQTLTLILRSEDGTEQQVDYSNSQGYLVRTVGGQDARYVATYEDLRFVLNNSLLTVSWRSESGPRSESWAVDRW
ncbi:MAG: hypothetical protein WC314_26040 [Vulcanimicrobiota bacterium]